MPVPKIAVIGSGISGLSTAYFLQHTHEVHLFEAADRIGGHANTVQVQMGGQSIPVDTGFIVFNTFTYPNLLKFFHHLGVPITKSDMSFSVSLDQGAFEYAGTNLDTLFCQRSNLVKIDFWKMVRDIVRFNRLAHKASQKMGYDVTLEAFLDAHSFSKAFRNWYLYPMACAIWSMPLQGAMAYPARTFIDFFHNHGLLRVVNQYPWLTVKGGSKTYVEILASRLKHIHVNTPVTCVRTGEKGVEVTTPQGVHHMDSVVFATDGAAPLKLLENPCPLQQERLGAFKVSSNRAVLHVDEALMPKRRKAWASWNYCLQTQEEGQGVCLSYWMNKLQNLESDHPLIVTLNPIQEPDPNKVIYETQYLHPLFDAQAIGAQQQLAAIQGKDNLWYVGAYHGYGFHEDGLTSGMRVAKQLGGVIPWES